MARMTIEELSRRTKTTTRNIRAYQSRGILPGPTLQGRVGVYDAGHVERLGAIAALQERGFSLAAIAELSSAWKEERTLDSVLGFARALREPWSAEPPLRLSRSELLAHFAGVAATPKLIRRLVELELMAADGDAFVVHSPRLLKVGVEMFAAGVPLKVALDELVKLDADGSAIARRFVEVFKRFVWAPYLAAGAPAGALPQVTDKLKGLRSIALLAVEAVFERAMEQEIATAIRVDDKAAPPRRHPT